MKKQVFIIHGGDSFDSYEQYLWFLKNFEIDFKDYQKPKIGWKKSLAEKLAEYEVIQPNMPNKTNAKYLEWKIWFEKFLPYIKPGVVFVGHSLGATFLIKYLSENSLNREVRGVFLVASAYDDNSSEYQMADFIIPDDLSKLESQTKNIFLYHSEDDAVVPFGDLGKFKSKLKSATVKVFKDRGHFIQEEFPELIEDIRKLK